jgi:site-specific recombinase XerD
MGNKLVTCACGCSTQFLSGKAVRKNYFLNREHAGRFKTEQTLQRCGIHLALVREYLDGFCLLHYSKSSRGAALTSLVVFCKFLNERGIVSMSDVGPKTITEFGVWGQKNGHNQVKYSMWAVKMFFSWQIAEERRTLGNPVIDSIHCIHREENSPRPFSPEDIAFAWKMLEERGNARVRLAMAIGEESGLRISEIVNIRLEDVDSVKQRIFVRKPTKNKKTRTVPYGDLTRKCLELWLEERDPECGHDHLLHGTFLKASTTQSLRDEFNRFLTKRGSTYHNGHQTNPDGFDTWSTHRLRHTCSSNLASGGADVSTVMAIGGWGSPKAMGVYTQIDQDVAQKGYESAMKRAKEQRTEKKPNRRISLADFIHETQTACK